MTLHLVKLCVGADSIADLRQWIALRQDRITGTQGHVHVTRMTPKRGAELLDGGSLYWVIRGQIGARQKLLGLERVVGEDAIGRCALVLDEQAIAVAPRPMRAFQGWRYLKPNDAPADLTASGAAEMPEEMRRQLAEFGLL
jgi:hypothetical protein